MDKKLRNTIIFGIITVSLSIGYCLTIKPIPSQKTEFDACYDKCFEKNPSGSKEYSCVSICGRNYSTN